MLIRLLCLLLAATLAALQPSQPASAQTRLECGATITKNTVLHHDLVDCPDNGLIIGADHVTLDLNGHRIAGDGRLTESCPDDKFCDGGVIGFERRDLTIKGGSISGFKVGVFLYSIHGLKLHRLTLRDNYSDGLVLLSSTRARIDDNIIAKNGAEPGWAGAALFAVSDSVIKGNRFSDNGDQGLFAADSSDGNQIIDNVFSGDTESGIGVDGKNNRIQGNRIAGGGMIVSGDDNVVKANRVVDPPTCDDGCGIGISIEGGARTVVERNVVIRAPVRGIRIDAYGAAATRNVVRGNIVRQGKGDGIGINLDNVGVVSETLVERNVVTGLGDDGIDVDSPTTVLRGNLTTRNGDLGIEAVPGVTDAGDNRAFANGNPQQCVNVKCTRSGS